MPRPRGEVREALKKALEVLGTGGAAAPAYRLAEASQVGYKVARQTLRNMAAAGEAQVIGHDKPAGSDRWHAMYALPEQSEGAGMDVLTHAMRGVTAPALA